MSGRRINDHSSWMGGMSKESVLPVGNKVRTMSSAEGAGAMNGYPDTEELVKRDQDANISKAKSRAQPAGRRN